MRAESKGIVFAGDFAARSKVDSCLPSIPGDRGRRTSSPKRMATSLSAAIRSALDLCSRQTLIFSTAPLRELWPQPAKRKRHATDVYRTKEDKQCLRVDISRYTAARGDRDAWLFLSV